MLYRVAADGVLFVHFAFVLFVVLGGLLVLRWPKLVWVHVPAALWGVLIEIGGWICPLTPLEVALRRAAGESGYAGDFIEHYVVALLYPDGLTHETQIALAGVVVAVNAAIYGAILRRRRAGR